MAKSRRIAGIDAGSATVSLVIAEEGGSVLWESYAFHRGRPQDALAGLLAEASAALGAALPAEGLARTATAPAWSAAGGGFSVDGRVAEILAARTLAPAARTLLVVGAEKFARTSLGPGGEYLGTRSNSSCAAGTGSFLDQQAARLGLEGSAELARMALSNAGGYPPIASRCSVFAKTDLIHAQQEGWKVAEICDGLCAGLARNIADTLFPGEALAAPVAMAGGVSRNAAVVRHLERLAGSPISVDGHSRFYGAIGACLKLVEEGAWLAEPVPLARLSVNGGSPLDYAAPELPPPSAGYPDFSSRRRFLHVSRVNGESNPVECDLYLDPAILGKTGAGRLRVLVGVDVGSTSTKAALLAEGGEPVAGFYTRTAGRPAEAAQAVFEAAERLAREEGLELEPVLAATTGSGRKLVGAVIGADSAIDEITAHARAAAELDPAIDTIIEIGGQDSKFTLLREGMVTFSQMNAVCAAGTGSFLEEQAGRLGVPLSAFAELATGSRAPLTSDRCTVFMERDLNHLQGLGYSTRELLAASLHSVCENYLSKVGPAGAMGRKIAFQGATAKNPALVAAFEQRLGRDLLVSKYCHLTGAIGAALQARDELLSGRDGSRDGAPAEGRPAGWTTSFRGLGIHALDLASRQERCELCANHCRLRVIDVGGEEVAYGFLCGRDYATKRYVQEGGGGRDFLAARRKAIDLAYARASARPDGSSGPLPGYPSLSIPTALYMADDAPFWKAFLERLGFPCEYAGQDAATLKEGKRLAGAEFCAPMAMLHGQVHSALAAADYAFFPVYLEEKLEKREAGNGRRYYCNFSQFAAVVARCAEREGRDRILSPLLSGRFGDDSRALSEMRETVGQVLGARGIRPPSARELREAREACLAAREEAAAAARAIYAEGARGGGGKLSVVLIGRPYTALSEAIGKDIPGMIAKRGADLYFHDMLPSGGNEAIDPLLAAFHWKYAAEVLKAADYCARTGGHYPVLVTSFKCSPDSFAIEWFKRIMDGAGKPYLVLQVDENDSSVGYETRIEAALRSFGNHARREGTPRAADSRRGERLPINPRKARALKGKTVLFPNWDDFVCRLLAANLKGHGLDVRLLEETPGAIRRAMASNTGQCIPIDVIVRETADAVEKWGLDPAKTVLWMIKGSWPCNINLYPEFIQSHFERMGGGLEKLDIYAGDLLFLYVNPLASIGAYHAFLAGGALRKLACRTRPYEIVPGTVDALADRAMAILVDAFEEGRNKAQAYKEAFGPFAEIAVGERDRPKVAIFGDIYVRDNDVFNQGLVREIEAAGGEVVTTPYIDYLKAVLDANFHKMLHDRSYGEWAKFKAALAVVIAVEKALSLSSGRYFGKQGGWANRGFEERLARLGIRPEHEGECFDNALKIFRILEEEPEVALFVQAAPAFCCPSIVTEAMGREIERVTGVPIISITYDGTGQEKNHAIRPYLALGREAAAAAAAKEEARDEARR